MQSKVYISLTLITCFSISCQLTFAATINVPVDQPTIQAGIDFANSGDTVLVDDGIYKGKGNINIDFMGKSITVKSRNGAETTIVDCENRFLTRGFIFKNNETETSVLDGFTIKNGMHEIGGGIYCVLASPTIKKCIISHNHATSTVEDVGGGGGMYFKQSSAKLIDCQISHNIADSTRGSGILFDTMVLETEQEIIIFEPVIATKCIISDNTGIGVFSYRSAPILRDCTVSKNSGRGILCDHISRGVMVDNCLIEQNNGGIECIRSSLMVINNCFIKQNNAYIGGGILCSPSSEVNVVGCIIYENTADVDGGGIYIDSRQGSALIKFCTIVNNYAADRGGGVFSITFTSIFTLTDSIIWGNESGNTQSQVRITSKGTVRNCDIQGGIDEIDLESDGKHFIYEDNIDADPMFFNIDSGNFRLKVNSPASKMGAYAPREGSLNINLTGKRIVRWADLKRK